MASQPAALAYPLHVPVPSAETFIIPVSDNRFIVYAPLRRAAFVANARTVNFIADLQRGVYDPSADPDGALAGFLRRLEIVDAGPEEKPITTFAGTPKPTAVTLFLTTACNLRCSYCYASAGDTPVQTMPLDVAKRGIDFVIANAVEQRQPHIEIAYHGGGEPTVNWLTLSESFAYAREQTKRHGLGLSAAAATNGVLSPAKIDWIIENLDNVSLSFDGLPALQDKHRPTAGGQGSSDHVLRTLRQFDDARFDYGLRLTVTADQIPHLPDAAAYIFSRFNPLRVQVEPAYQLGRWTEAASAETEAFIESYRAAQRIAKAHDAEISYSGARLGALTNHFCGVTQDSFCLSPDGNVSGCYEVFSEDAALADTFFYGKPTGDGGYAFDLDILNNLRNQAVEHRDYCNGCFAKWNCAGDCYHKAIAQTGSTEFEGSDRCHITRELTKDQILTAILDAGGLFWHGAPEEPLPGMIEEALTEAGND